jgi:hypothetical protein
MGTGLVMPLRQLGRFPSAVLLFIILTMMGSRPAFAYSVLTHEEIVDLAWTDSIKPLLLKRFPESTDEQIAAAHAYAYGGAVIQDLGYYPFGSVEFSNLTHYVRSGDFVIALLEQSQDLDEFAFALGALSHYAADITGHPSVNQSVAMEYPKLRAKFGNSVRYADDKNAHLRIEFGFDMAQVAKNRYASEQYHQFIGFQVSKPLLERVFPIVYGLELKDVLAHEDLAIGSYRWAVSQMIPEMTKVALQTHKKEILAENPTLNKQKFLFRLSRSDYEKKWGKDYVKPGFRTRMLSSALRYIPKVGPFKAMAFNYPTPKTEELYFKSILATADRYKQLLAAEGAATLLLPNCDFDTGKPVQAAEYKLTDDAYAKWLGQLAKNKFDKITPELRADILHFYADPAAAFATKQDAVRWQQVLAALDQLKQATPISATTDDPAPFRRSSPLDWRQ